MAQTKSAGGLIPRKVLFGNPERASVQVSPDGRHVTYLAPLDGVMNIYIAPIYNIKAAKHITHDANRGIRTYQWAYDNRHILYLQDKDGDENWHLYALDIEKERARNLTDFEDTRIVLSQLSELYKEEVLIQSNSRRKDFFDLYKVNIITGELSEIYRNDEFSGLIVDRNFRLRFVQKINEDGEVKIYQLDTLQRMTEFMTVAPEDINTTSIIGFDKTGDVLYMIDSVGRNTAVLATLDLTTGQKTVVYENVKADVHEVLIHPTEKNLQLVAYNYLRQQFKVLDHEIESDYQYIKTFVKGELSILSRSLDDSTWIIADIRDNAPVAYYRYDKPEKVAEFLFHGRPDLAGYELCKMHPILIKARDNLDLISYLTLPHSSGYDESTMHAMNPVPLVVWVHGGPTARDVWGYNAVHQWLANRGYAVLSVNYRGSTGFGKSFINAGDGEWSRKMHTDLLDAVSWAISRGVTTRDKVAIGGGSYGGYAALVGLTFSPNVFSCAVDIVGPSNLITLSETVPPYWKPIIASLEKKLGGSAKTEAGRRNLAARSPINFVDNIKKPLLIGQGANDPRVKQSESDQIVALMVQKNIPVSYILYPEEGHGFVKPENNISFYAFVEKFFGQWLGGKVEPIGDFNGANFEVKAGAEFLKMN